MTGLTADARWWVQTDLEQTVVDAIVWLDSGLITSVRRRTEVKAVYRVGAQARREWPHLVREVAALDRWYAVSHPELDGLTRADLLMHRCKITPAQLRDALDEATAMMEE